MKQIPIFVAILLALSLILLIGFGGTGLNVVASPDDHFFPYSTGHVLIDLTNGWWGRNIRVEQISFSIEAISNFDWKVGNYSSNISPGEAIRIQANLTVREYRSGVFNYSLTIEFVQSRVFNFGSEGAQQTIRGNITIS